LPPTLNPVQSGGPGEGATLPGGTLPANPSIQLVKIADGLADPVNVAAAGDDSGRLFVVERIGRIRVIDRDGNLLDEPFLDLTELVQSDYLEQGILGLAFHPDYKNNGRFYVNFTDFHTNGDTFVMEFRVSEDNPNVADRASGRLLMAFDQPYVNHNWRHHQVRTRRLPLYCVGRRWRGWRPVRHRSGPILAPRQVAAH
jgi:hypothetical protein